MGQKINPTGFRVGISKDWSSRWFVDKNAYSKYVLEDFKIREILSNKFALAGVKSIDIERSPNEVNIRVHVSKPGVVIGRGGSIVDAIKKDLEKITTSKISITAEEVKTPEIEAKLVADFIARQLKRRKPYRGVVASAINSALDKGAKGIKIKLAGLLSGGNSIARSERFSKGPVPTQTLRADIDYAQVHCKMIFGLIGIKVWIYKGEQEI